MPLEASRQTYPQTFGRYTILGKLGSGGMADALLAMLDGGLGFQKVVVVKRMHASLGRDEHFVKMFLDEARLAAKLNHPNVVTTSEVGETDGQYFIAMEYLEGLSLDRIARRYIQGGESVPLGLLLRALCDCLEGLHHAHELRDFDGTHLAVVHRDVTPSNLFVTSDGVAKVLDFGIAKAATQDEATRTGMLKGKLAYMAPEQFFSAPIDRRADLWSMGVVIWEMTTGRRLFKGPNDAATYKNIASGSIPSVRTYRPDAPSALDPVIARALARDREQRYQTADEMRAAIDALLREHLGGTTRADVADEVRKRFGEMLEENRKAIRAYVQAGTQGSKPLGLSSVGEIRTGVGGTIIPSVSALNARDLGIPMDDDEDDLPGEVTQVTDAHEVGAKTVPTPSVASHVIEVDARAYETATTIEKLPQATMDALRLSTRPGPPSPSFPRQVPSFAEGSPLPSSSWAPPTPPPAPWTPSTPPTYAEPALFDPIPPEVLHAQERAKKRAALTQSLVKALGWLILLGVIAGVAALVWSRREWLRTAIDQTLHGAPPDPASVGSFRLRIESTPPGARVYDGAQELGMTPIELDIARGAVREHPRRFVLRLDGYTPTTVAQSNTLDARALVRATLVRANPRQPTAPAVLRAPRAATPPAAPPVRLR